MLRTLAIRDVVLIDRLEVEFQSGLAVLTGETGAGKSILLDALGLALGARAEAGLVRHGAAEAVVAAAFEIEADHPVHAILTEQGIESDGNTMILRRVVSADGRSRAFIDDQPASIGLLRRVGETLVDIHGQFENQRLLSTATHRMLLDSHAGLDPVRLDVEVAWKTWRNAKAARDAAEEQAATARRDEEFVRHAAGELTAFDPKPDEESSLAKTRALLQSGEAVIESLTRADGELAEGRGVEAAIGAALRHLQRLAAKAEGLEPASDALERARTDVGEARAFLARFGRSIDLDPKRLEEIEERLFALRALARKHNVTTNDLPRVRDEFVAKLEAIDGGAGGLDALKKAEAVAAAAYANVAGRLGKARRDAAGKLDTAIAKELKPLKLGQARFATAVEALDEAAWGPSGQDAVDFRIATNPGVPPGPLNKVSSGGELARLMLALKVVLARADRIPTIIFDEVDAGVSGAVASAVGERLAKLAGDFQVLAVTHSPQVAARADHHFRVAKDDAKARAITRIEVLSADDRREEIARMLAGTRVTEEARAAAQSLIEGPTR